MLHRTRERLLCPLLFALSACYAGATADGEDSPGSGGGAASAGTAGGAGEAGTLGPGAGSGTAGSGSAGSATVDSATGATGENDPGAGSLDEPATLGRAAVRRLTKEEFRQTVIDVLGVDPGTMLDLLPLDSQTPFDNDYTEQFASAGLIEAYEAIADHTARAVLADPAARSTVITCTPSAPDDANCLATVVRGVGRRLWRRPLTDAEVTSYLGLTALGKTAGSFDGAVRPLLRALLQDLRFVYRIEIGTPTPGQPDLLVLDDFEVASRLSYLLWGSAPDEALLDVAGAGGLGDAAGVRKEAERMLADPRARARTARFHAMWLGYDRSPHDPGLAQKLRRESDALVVRTVFKEPGAWRRLFTSRETFLDADLATHYGLPWSGTASESKWVTYPDDRQGILSHGSVLSNGSKSGDTSPTRRGRFIRHMLLCQTIPPPPPDLMVDVDATVKRQPGTCKWDAYAAHRVGGCASCHKLMDPLGFGLEGFDDKGRPRTVEPGQPSCSITGEGDLDGTSFRGPGALAELVVSRGSAISECFTRQLFRFAVGRRERDEDDPALATLAAAFVAVDDRLDRLLVDLVTSASFRHRFVE